MSVTICARGCRHWGRYGASGLLLHSHDHVLLQLRGAGQHTRTWAVPGGAIEPGERPLDAALREAHEEVAGLPTDIHLTGRRYVDDHHGWAYTTFIATAARLTAVQARDAESLDIRWVPAPDVDRLRLHPGFANAWPRLRSWLTQDSTFQVA